MTQTYGDFVEKFTLNLVYYKSVQNLLESILSSHLHQTKLPKFECIMIH